MEDQLHLNESLDWTSTEGKLEPDQLPAEILLGKVIGYLKKGTTVSDIKKRARRYPRIIKAIEGGYRNARHRMDLTRDGEAKRNFIAAYEANSELAYRRIGKVQIPVFNEDGQLLEIHEEDFS